MGSAPETYFSQAWLKESFSQRKCRGFPRANVKFVERKIVRLDPETGDGVPGNPFFDPSNPRSAPSRIWSLGLRNPFGFRFVPAPAAIDTRTRIRACSTSVTLVCTASRT